MTSIEENCLSDSSFTHTRVLDYSYRVPTPPRIVIPPPTISLDDKDFGLNQIAQQINQQYGLDFLEALNYNGIGKTTTVLEWTYERRREAQEILPFLSLGPMTAARNKEYLQKQGITMLMAARPRQAMLSSAAARVAVDLGIHLETIDASTAQDLIAAFPRAIRTIQQHLHEVHLRTGGQKLGKVLVFCESGNDRSAAFTAAYLMETFNGVDHIKAMQIVQAQRFCVNFDDVHKNLLRSYWDIVQARRSVAEAQSSEIPQHQAHEIARSDTPLGRKSKRTRHDSDDDVDMDDGSQADDEARFEGRLFFPFKDGA